jgi:spore maturation protein CgeB
MKIVIFGLSVTSSWGNGHATLLRGLLKALRDLGHVTRFFERDTPYYAAHRDAPFLSFAQVHLYSDWNENLPLAHRELIDADVGIVTSYCPDGVAACRLVLESSVERKIFYDMDTPVTLDRIDKGESVPYIPPEGLGGFDLVLSYTGGASLNRLRNQLSARRVATLYGWVDPATHYRRATLDRFQCDLSYLGTYSQDRQDGLRKLLLEPAAKLSDKKFVIAGAMYPEVNRWPSNVRYYDHIAPPEHPAFYSSSLMTLNVTRASMAETGYCPSGRLFEAAACGTCVLSDWWEGLDRFFEPRDEILIATSESEAIDAISTDASALTAIGSKARTRVLDCHTADIRARRLIDLIEMPSAESTESHQYSLAAEGA